MLVSRTFAKRIGQIFHWSDDSEKEMLVQVVRLCVLYEDFQIEMTGAMEDSIKVLDATSRDTRRFYFVRRHLATFLEISGALHKLNLNRSFRDIRDGMETDQRRRWDGAVAFFSGQHHLLKAMRNDVGGHFHDAAARFALEEIAYDTPALFELYLRGTGADVKVKFAYDFVANALIKNREEEQSEDEFLMEAFGFMLEAMKQIVNSVHVVVEEMFFKRAR